jgi:hypothetical protein
MRLWIVLAIVATFLCGCRSMSHSDKARTVKADQDIRANVPTGEGPPFGPPPS